jgi:hypothetical protein
MPTIKESQLTEESEEERCDFEANYDFQGCTCLYSHWDRPALRPGNPVTY